MGGSLLLSLLLISEIIVVVAIIYWVVKKSNRPEYHFVKKLGKFELREYEPFLAFYVVADDLSEVGKFIKEYISMLGHSNPAMSYLKFSCKGKIFERGNGKLEKGFVFIADRQVDYTDPAFKEVQHPAVKAEIISGKCLTAKYHPAYSIARKRKLINHVDEIEEEYGIVCKRHLLHIQFSKNPFEKTEFLVQLS